MERSLAYRAGVIARRILGLTPRVPRTFMLMGEVFAYEDWRVSGRRPGPWKTGGSVSFCSSYPEALSEAAYMRGAGFRGVKIRRRA